MARAKGKRLRAEGRGANLKVFATGATSLRDTVPTDDPCDRAHDQRDGDNYLKRATAVPDGMTEPRRYPACHMLRVIRQWVERDLEGSPVLRRVVVGQVSFETEMEETAERERRLQEQDLLRPMPSMAEEMRRAMGYQQGSRT